MKTLGKKLLIDLSSNAMAVCIMGSPLRIVIDTDSFSGYKSNRLGALYVVSYSAGMPWPTVTFLRVMGGGGGIFALFSMVGYTPRFSGEHQCWHSELSYSF
jgi:hypothetical protein